MISEKQWADFFDKLSERGNIAAACRAAGVARSTVYEHVSAGEAPEAAPDAKAWKVRYQAALDDSIDRLDSEAYRRAHDGFLEPVYFQGIECGTIRRYSDGLLMFLLRARRPAVYKERTAQELSGPGGRPIQTESRVIVLPMISEGSEE